MTSIDDVAQSFIKVLDGLQIPYALMGGLAVRALALPRATFDVDFTIVVSDAALGDLIAAAEQEGFVVPTRHTGGWVDRVQQMPVMNFQWFTDNGVIDVDLFLAETAFQLELIRRRQRHTALGWEGWFVSPEDLVLLKLLANRPKDQIDVGDIFFIQGQLDEEYLRTWGARLHISDRVEAALANQTLPDGE